MDGIHDLGGKHGHGLVIADLDSYRQDKPAFAHRWEGAVFTITNSLFNSGVAHNVDHFRHAIERIDPVSYLTDTYYGRWLGGAEMMLVEAGVIKQTELEPRQSAPHGGERVAARPGSVQSPVTDQQNSQRQNGAERQISAAPQFEVGQTVVTQTVATSGHTRLPAYARGRPGIITACHGGWIYPDTNAHDEGEQPQYLYTVEFSGQTLWGDECETGLCVCIDLFEPYLYEMENLT